MVDDLKINAVAVGLITIYTVKQDESLTLNCTIYKELKSFSDGFALCTLDLIKMFCKYYKHEPAAALSLLFIL